MLPWRRGSPSIPLRRQVEITPKIGSEERDTSLGPLTPDYVRPVLPRFYDKEIYEHKEADLVSKRTWLENIQPITKRRLRKYER